MHWWSNKSPRHTLSTAAREIAAPVVTSSWFQQTTVHRKRLVVEADKPPTTTAAALWFPVVFIHSLGQKLARTFSWKKKLSVIEAIIIITYDVKTNKANET